jgi:hypothetical protein
VKELMDRSSYLFVTLERILSRINLSSVGENWTERFSTIAARFIVVDLALLHTCFISQVLLLCNRREVVITHTSPV